MCSGFGLWFRGIEFGPALKERGRRKKRNKDEKLRIRNGDDWYDIS